VGFLPIADINLLRHVFVPNGFFRRISARAGDLVTRLAPRAYPRSTVVCTPLDVPGGEVYPPGFREMAAAQARDSLNGTDPSACKKSVFL